MSMTYKLQSQVQGAQSVKKRILVVDDHPIVRQGLALMINREADLVVLRRSGGRDRSDAGAGVGPARCWCWRWSGPMF
jgi:hypothetical protein